MLDDDFRIAAAFRLRAPIPIDSLSVLNPLPSNQQVCSFCGKNNNNIHGDHAFSCSGISKARKHNALSSSITESVLRTDPTIRRCLQIKHEGQVLTFFPRLPDGQHDLRADVLIDTDVPNLDNLRRKCVDYMITHPKGDTVAGRTYNGTAARAGEELKYTKYTGNHVMERSDVIPVVFETYGTLGPAGHKFLADLATLARPVGTFTTPDGVLRLLDYDGLRASFIRQLRERIAVTIQRGNSILLREWAVTCCPKGPHAAGAAGGAAGGGGAGARGGAGAAAGARGS